jgi:ATP-dependent DNA helicase RecQ
VSSDKVPKCPSCGKIMILRTVKNGPRVGSKFWGCSGFPSCRGTRSVIEFSAPSVTSEQKVPARSGEKLELEAIPEQSHVRWRLPKTVTLESNIASKQVRIYQTVATDRSLVEIIHVNANKIQREAIWEFSQWRLDYPSDKSISKHEFSSSLATLEKIMLRGSIIPPTLKLEKAFHDEFGNKISTKEWFISLKKLRKTNRYNHIPHSFDSNAEKAFYHFLNSDKKIGQWVTSQVPLTALVDAVVDESNRQRVDFLLAKPGEENLVVEIDGQQHQQNLEADRKRDSLLKAAGYKVLRIEASKVNNLNFFYQTRFSKYFSRSSQDWGDLHRNDRLAFGIACLKACSQIQIALLEAVKLGKLPLTNNCIWRICVISPDHFAIAKNWHTQVKFAVEDVIDMLSYLIRYQYNIGLKIGYSLQYEENENEADITVRFEDGKSNYRDTLDTFTISDIYLPIEMCQPIPESDTAIISEPCEEVASYFLKYIFGKPSFKEKQWDAIARVAKNQDTILLLPTGHGKSIVFQLASFLKPGICLVIDPLLSLIEDQIDNLGRHGIDHPIGITSLLTQKNRIDATDTFSKAFHHFCYISPERFQIKEFRSAVESLVISRPISVIAIDEAHCVSEWGHDFRVSYLNLARNARNYASKDNITPPVIAMTGTASRSVLRDMRRELEIQSYESLISLDNFDRPELNFKVEVCHSNDKFDVLEKILKKIPEKYPDKETFYDLKDNSTNGGLVFMPHVNGPLGVSETYKFLSNNGYHGKIGIFSGKSPKSYDRPDWDQRKQYEAQSFKNNEKNILVCTNAFGMGIDKENIRYTIHMNLPQSIESAYQEAGRAGRDRKESWCYFIVSPDYPERINRLLDPNTTLDQVNEMIAHSNYKNDDITRQLYFHTSSFKGIEKELAVIYELIGRFGNLRKKSRYQIGYTASTKILYEKAVHRLLTVGVLNDYEVDYAHEVINLQLSGCPPEENLDCFIHYIENYDSNMAESERVKAGALMFEPHADFVMYLIERLTKEFIYGVIEQSRRRSLSEMLQACQGEVTNETFRQRILNYFNLSHYSSFVESCIDDLDYLSSSLTEIMDEIKVPVEAADLRGQVSRQLEAYPKNPPLLLLRSLAECFCIDRQKNVIFENFLAYLKFSFESWGRELKDTISFTAEYINELSNHDLVISEELVVATIQANSDKRLVEDILLEECHPQLTLYIVHKRLERIVLLVKKALTKGD